MFVRWVDSVRHQGGWDSASEYADRATEDELLHGTLGWIIAEKDHSLTIAQSRGLNDGDDVNVTEVIQIPRVAITDIKELDIYGKADERAAEEAAEGRVRWPE